MNTIGRAGLPALIAMGLALILARPAAAHERAQFPVQSLDDRGADVVALQHLLRFHGHDITLTGYFGPETHSALAAYQESVGLDPSGIAHVSTWERIVPALSLGASSEAVLALKTQLNAKRRAALSLTPTFDSATLTAVRALQQHMNLRATGTVDSTTWKNLLWHYVRPDFSRPSLCNYNGGSTAADWGTAAAIAHLQAAADIFRARTGGRTAVGDISFEHGGDIRLHSTHEHGLDIDIALVRLDGRQCSNPGISYTSRQYDRADTRALLQAVHEAFGSHLKLIYFNDPVLVGEGLSRKYPNHADHIHIRVCEPSHAQAHYVC